MNGRSMDRIFSLSHNRLTNTEGSEGFDRQFPRSPERQGGKEQFAMVLDLSQSNDSSSTQNAATHKVRCRRKSHGSVPSGA